MRYALPFFLLLSSMLPLAAWAAPVAHADAASTPGKTPVPLAVTANDLGGPNPATVDFNASTTGTRLTTRAAAGQAHLLDLPSLPGGVSPVRVAGYTLQLVQQE